MFIELVSLCRFHDFIIRSLDTLTRYIELVFRSHELVSRSLELLITNYKTVIKLPSDQQKLPHYHHILSQISTAVDLFS